MTAVFVPVSRVSVSYTVKRGRRWTVLEHLLLLELRETQAKAAHLAYLTRMPTRVVVEALINLLRAGWVEVRATDEAVLFTATSAGRAVAAREELPAELSVHPRRTSLCFDRLVGTFMKSDDLDLLHENKVPVDAVKLDPRTFTVPKQDGELVERLYYDRDEIFDDWRGYVGVSNRFYARVDVTPDEITGLPGYAADGLKHEIFEQASPHISSRLQAEKQYSARYFSSDTSTFWDTLRNEDFIIGGEEHFDVLRQVLRKAKSIVVIHSCFIHFHAIERIFPDIEQAAERGVRVDLLWGVVGLDLASPSPHPLERVRTIFEKLSFKAKHRVMLAEVPTGSHAKLLIHDADDRLEVLIGSCNWLSASYKQTEISIRSGHPHLVGRIAQILAGLQMPSSGPWPASTRRLLELWRRLRDLPPPPNAIHRLSLVLDDEHYAVVRRSRDLATSHIVVGCDLFGVAAETSVLIPADTSARRGIRVTIIYSRLTSRLKEDDRGPDEGQLLERGLELVSSPNLHGKFLTWDDDNFCITSFNWLSTTIDPSKPRFAEIGVLGQGSGLAQLLLQRLTSTGFIPIPEANQVAHFYVDNN